MRLDDPHDGFETGSRRIVGDLIYKLLQDINTDMNNFIREERYQTETAFQRIFFRIRRLLEFQNHPFASNPNDWINTSTDKFAIKTNDEPRRHRVVSSEEQKLYEYEVYNGLFEFCAVASDNAKKCCSA